MRLTKFINEMISPAEEYEITKTLGNECSQIIKFYQQSKAYLYRGIESRDEFIKNIGRVETGRVPRDTSIAQHEWANEWFKKKFGWPVRNGISTSPVPMTTEMYGDLYIFFPTDGFKYVWSRHIEDFTNSIPSAPDMWIRRKLKKGGLEGFKAWLEIIYKNNMKPNNKTWKRPHPEWNADTDKANQIYEIDWKKFINLMNTYQNQRLEKAVNSNFEGEIMFNAKKYYLLRASSNNENILDDLGLNENWIRF